MIRFKFYKQLVEESRATISSDTNMYPHDSLALLLTNNTMSLSNPSIVLNLNLLFYQKSTDYYKPSSRIIIANFNLFNITLSIFVNNATA